MSLMFTSNIFQAQFFQCTLSKFLKEVELLLDFSANKIVILKNQFEYSLFGGIKQRCQFQAGESFADLTAKPVLINQ